VIDSDPEAALPVLYDILGRYSDSTEPGEKRIAEAVRGLIAELEGDQDGTDT
jgi:hypothetical protein